ncbi:MAG: hypothetical protein LYZ69_05445 [Nitrososphaerales archaeon]|nr:hypothetical protein [Nitrososphaerales archaeon]
MPSCLNFILIPPKRQAEKRGWSTGAISCYPEKGFYDMRRTTRTLLKAITGVRMKRGLQNPCSTLVSPREKNT